MNLGLTEVNQMVRTKFVMFNEPQDAIIYVKKQSYIWYDGRCVNNIVVSLVKNYYQYTKTFFCTQEEEIPDLMVTLRQALVNFVTEELEELNKKRLKKDSNFKFEEMPSIIWP